MAEGYNRGMSQSSGSILIFSHDDVEFLASDFRARVVGHMSQHDVLGVLGTVRLTGAQWWNGSGMPYVYGQMAYPGKSGEGFDVLVWSVPTRAVGGIQAMDGMFLCVRRNVLQLLQFDADSFPGKTGYDVDFTYRAHRQGLRLSVANHLYPICASLPAQDADWIDSARRFDRKYEGQLPVHLRQRFQVGIVSVSNREEIIDVMSPPHWKTQA